MDKSTWATNHTGQLDFILMGLFSQAKHPAFLCVVIFVIFLMALSGNITKMTAQRRIGYLD